MNRILEKLNDVLEAFAEAYKYAELDFYKVKSEVVTLMDKARGKGYDYPAYCELKIEIINNFETDVTIQNIYKRDGKFFRFKKTIDVGKLVNIPHVVRKKLEQDHSITIKLEDFQNLYAVNENEIKSTVAFKSLETFTFKGVSDTPVQKTLTIQDELFYYSVLATYVFADGSKKSSKKYYGDIIGLPENLISEISQSEELKCTIDVSEK